MDSNGELMLFESFGTAFLGCFWGGWVKRLLGHGRFAKARSQAFTQQQAARMTDGDHDPGEPQPCSPKSLPICLL